MLFELRGLSRHIMNQPIEMEGANTPIDSGKPHRVRYRCRSAAMAAIILVAVLASAISVYSSSPLTASQSQAHANIMQIDNASVSQTIGGSITVSIGSSSQSQQATTQSMTQSTPMTTQTTAVSTQTTPVTSQTTVSASQTQTSITVSQSQQASTTSTVQTVTTVSQLPQSCGYYGCYPYPSNPYTPYPPYAPGYPAYPGYYPNNAYGGCSYQSSYTNVVQCYGYVFRASNGCVELVVAAVNAPYYGGTALQYYTLHNLSSVPASGTWVLVMGQMYQGYNTSSTGAGCPGNYINVNSITRY
jgi:hypothetical protein